MRVIKTSSRHHKKNRLMVEALLASPVAADLLGERPSVKLVAEVHKQLVNDRKFFVRIDSGPLKYV